MKIFDLHADIGYDVYHEIKKGNKDVLATRHLPYLKKGDIQTICMASYFEGDESWDDMRHMVTTLKEEIERCPNVHLINTPDDFYKEGIHAILSIEGMCGIQHDIEACIDCLYELGIKVASLTWNDENTLATGVKGNPSRGLSEAGIKAVKRMEEHHMIIDVSHANEQTFWDIMKHFHGSVIATHSNARSLCDHARNLYDEQLLAIKERGGVIGIVSAPFFIHKNLDKQDVSHLVDHIDYMVSVIGIDHIAIGFDFMNFFEGYDTIFANGLKDARDAQNLIEEMKLRGYSDDEINKVAYENAKRVLISSLKEQGL